jgi:hypothetical protein
LFAASSADKYLSETNKKFLETAATIQSAARLRSFKPKANSLQFRGQVGGRARSISMSVDSETVALIDDDPMMTCAQDFALGVRLRG